MPAEEHGPHDVRAALALITCRLDAIASSLAQLQPASRSDTSPEIPPAGEPLDQATRARLRGFESLLAVTAELGRESAIILAVDRAIHHAGADSAALFLPTESGSLTAAARRGLPPGPLHVGPGQGIVGRAFAERDTIQAGPAHQSADGLLRTHGLTYALAVPLRAPEHPVPVGVLFAGRRRAEAFGDDALQTMMLLADRLGRLVAEATSGAREGSPPLVTDLDLGRTAARVAEMASTRLAAPQVAVWLPGEGSLTLAGGCGLPPAAAPPEATSGAVAGVFATGRPWVAAEGPADESLARALGAPPQLVVPLLADGRLVAFLAAGGFAPCTPDAIADLIPGAAAALRNACLYAATTAALAERDARRSAPVILPSPVRDFGSLLAVVLARIGLVRERVGDPAATSDLRVAEEAAWRAAEAVRGFLGFAPGRRDGPSEPVELGRVIRDAVEAARCRWRERADPAPQLEVTLEPLPPVRGSADDLREALSNLLDNAAEATPTGGVVEVGARWDGERRVEVTVEDHGSGMDEAVLARALEPFFSTRGAGRLGLGLPVAKAIAAQHRGTLEITSVAGAGTTVRLGLPTGGTGRQATAPAARDLAPGRVLVLEGDVAVRETLVALIAQQGHVTLAAGDAREGLALVDSGSIDVVVVDLGLPGGPGPEVARAVKRRHPGTPVILLTAWPGRLDDEVARDSGIDRVIEKPVGAAEVLAAVDAALALRRTIRAG